MGIGISRHGSQLFTASGALGVAGKPKYIYAMNIRSGASLGVVTITDNGAGGTTYIKEKGTNSSAGSTFSYSEGFFFPDDAYVTIDANVVSVLISYDEAVA